MRITGGGGGGGGRRRRTTWLLGGLAGLASLGLTTGAPGAAAGSSPPAHAAAFTGPECARPPKAGSPPRTCGHCPERVVATTAANVSHAGWPPITGCLSINAGSINAVIDLRGTTLHNELLGGHGNDAIYAGAAGDVIWGDNFPNGQPGVQVDRLNGGPGNDFIYSSHGLNHISTGAGADKLYLVYGHGDVTCGPGHKTLTMRKLPQNRHWKLTGCSSITIIPKSI